MLVTESCMSPHLTKIDDAEAPVESRIQLPVKATLFGDTTHPEHVYISPDGNCINTLQTLIKLDGREVSTPQTAWGLGFSGFLGFETVCSMNVSPRFSICATFFISSSLGPTDSKTGVAACEPGMFAAARTVTSTVHSTAAEVDCMVMNRYSCKPQKHIRFGFWCVYTHRLNRLGEVDSWGPQIHRLSAAMHFIWHDMGQDTYDGINELHHHMLSRVYLGMFMHNTEGGWQMAMFCLYLWPSHILLGPPDLLR